MAIRLLVVDDSLTIRKLVELSFRSGDYALEFASSGSEGIDKAQGQVDVVLLDYILPDMKGLDVVARLHESPRTASLPIVIMTAKSADVRAHFRGYPAVVDFVTKPFTPEDIIERVGKAARTSGGHAADAALPLARKEAAQVIYTRLRASLGKIPEWHKDLGDAPAAAYFAKKILTPVVVEDILAGLVPHVAQAVPASPPQEMQLVGRFSALPFGALAQQLERAGHSGEVRVTVGERETVLYFRAGELVLASTADPDAYMEDAGLDTAAVPYEAFARAAADQRGGGKPLPITLAEGGHIALGQVRPLLHRQSKRLVSQLLRAGDGRFAWPAPSTLPTWVDAHAQVVSLAGLELARLRSDEAPSGEPLHADAVFEREAGFSKKIDAMELSADETRLLAQVDGRMSVAGMIDSTGMPTDFVHRALRALRDIGVVRERGGRKSTASGPVLVWDRDQRGVLEPLERMLRNRGQPLRVRRVDGLSDMLTALERERSPLCIVNTADAGADAAELARVVRGSAERVETALLAVLESFDGEQAKDLTSAGFDRVAVKPIHLLEIEQMLTE